MPIDGYAKYLGMHISPTGNLKHEVGGLERKVAISPKNRFCFVRYVLCPFLFRIFSTCNDFAKILKNECDEEFRLIQNHVKDTLI